MHSLPVRSAAVALALLLLVGLPACRTGSPVPALVDDTRMAMGSELRIAVWTGQEAAARTALAAAFAEFDRLKTRSASGARRAMCSG